MTRARPREELSQNQQLVSIKKERITLARRSIVTAMLSAVLAVSSSAALGASPASASSSLQGPIIITCAGCQDSKTDIFVHEEHLETQEFNQKYKGVYEIKTIPFAGINDLTQSVPYFQRLALANELPDLWWGQSIGFSNLAKTGHVLNIAPYLKSDPTSYHSFYPDAFVGLADSKGDVWGVPQYRDAIGTFWNKKLFAEAGLSSFPRTWAELLADCQKLKAAGITPLALDGQWVDLLWWANLIGTQPGGAAFLDGGLLKGDFAKWPQVVLATERLKQLQAFANVDSFSGNFSDADTQFVTGKAAMLANGPWEIASGIKGPDAIPGLYNDVAYASPPGNGVMVVSGTGSWGSGARSPRQIKAVVAFMKFMTSEPVAIAKYKHVDGAWPVRFPLSSSQVKKVLAPMYYPLWEAANSSKNTYVYPQFLAATAFPAQFTNDWPAYVQGGMSTTQFLDDLSAAATGSN
jgi:raffinose/stachyose/melibiose transport system substrate-binding protein